MADTQDDLFKELLAVVHHSHVQQFEQTMRAWSEVSRTLPVLAMQMTCNGYGMADEAQAIRAHMDGIQDCLKRYEVRLGRLRGAVEDDGGTIIGTATLTVIAD